MLIVPISVTILGELNVGIVQIRRVTDVAAGGVTSDQFSALVELVVECCDFAIVSCQDGAVQLRERSKVDSSNVVFVESG